MNRVQQLRIDARLTPTQLAEKTGVSRRTIERIESGKGARVETLGALADFFNVPASTLTMSALGPDREAA